jgi:hypothetical protein
MELALSLYDQFEKNHALLGKPVSTLARMAGMGVNDVYSVLLPELINTDIAETIKYAETALKYSAIVDRNRLREECGEEFIMALNLIIGIVGKGLASSEGWIKRKAIILHGSLIDECSEKQRFIETLITERKIEMLTESKNNITNLNNEIIDFEMKEKGLYVEVQ